jgi:hypothetical protein
VAVSGNDLFVASTSFSPIANTSVYPGTVGEYNATTGAAINASLIPYDNSGSQFDPFTGLPSYPVGLAVSGNDLFVANWGQTNGTTVSEYNATTGAGINASFITGLHGPSGLALSGNNLFVVNNVGGTVGEYNATTGAPINASFITGLNGPAALVVVPVPEPSAWSMIAVGGVALLGMMLRKKHHSA